MKKIRPDFTAFLLLLICTVLFATCHKEYSYEGGPKKNTAVYTLVGAGGSCTGSILAGTYYMGKALTSASTVQLQVDVTTTGSYSLSTGSVNGFYFSASGNFVNTGVQNIVLTANGTPTAIGNFVFTATAGSGCTFSVTVIKEPVIMAGFTLDCQNADVNGNFQANSKLTNAHYVVIKVNVTAVGAYAISTDTLDGIYFSAAGVFSSTGSKSVTLNGSGTPDLARNLVFTPKGNGSSCTFKITVTNSQPLAVYVLESGSGNPSPCISTVSGNYVTNTPLSSSNTVLMSVFVTAKGYFTIATATVNGMTFAYSGEFTILGAQKIILQGSGTPAAKGIFSLLPEIVGPHPLGGQICGFNVTVQ